MELQGQASQRGYAMAALLVSLGVMAVLMAAALPVWRHEMQREKEAELIFRGESYARAIARFQRKMGPGVYPATIDILVEQRFLRKKYKDPMSEDGEFQPLFLGSSPGTPSPGSPTPGRAGSPSPGRAGTPSPGRAGSPAAPTGFSPPPSGPGGATAAGIYGVVSKSKETSIRIYKGMTHYNEWSFVAQQLTGTPGGPGRTGGPGGGPTGRSPGTTGPGGPGRGPGGGPGGPGRTGGPGIPPPGRRGGGG